MTGALPHFIVSLHILFGSIMGILLRANADFLTLPTWCEARFFLGIISERPLPLIPEIDVILVCYLNPLLGKVIVQFSFVCNCVMT